MEKKEPLVVIKEISEELQCIGPEKPTDSLFLIKVSGLVKEPPLLTVILTQPPHPGKAQMGQEQGDTVLTDFFVIVL